MRFLLFVIVCSLSLYPADLPADRDGERKPRKPEHGQGPGMQRLQSAPVADISDGRAVSLVKQQYAGSRILGVSLMGENETPVYRVRTLSPDGVVKSVFVDGSSGEVFE